MGREYSNESRSVFYSRLRSSNYWQLCHYLTPPKKHVLNYFALEMAAIIVARRRHRREQRVRGRRERISFFYVLIYLERTCYPNILFAKLCYF